MDLNFAPVGPRRMFEGAVQQIAEKVRRGEIATGDRLPSERDLAATMQISRATLREAIQVLAEAGVLEVRPGSSGGIYAASDYVPLELVRSKSDLRLSEVAGVLEARRMLEPRVAQLAALHATEDDFAELSRIIDAQRTMVEEGTYFEQDDRFLQLDMQFHQRIALATRNSTIVELMKLLLARLETARDLAIRDGPAEVAPWVIHIHEETLAAIRSADHQRIEAVMDEHLAGVERAWEATTGRALVRSIPDFLRPVEQRARKADSD